MTTLRRPRGLRRHEPTLTARTVLDTSRFPAWWFDELANGGMVSEGDAVHTRTPVSASRVDELVAPT